MKRLYRSRTNSVIAGVCGGLGEYFEVDPVIVRVFYLLATVFTGVIPGILGYIIVMLMVPYAPTVVANDASEV